MKNSFNIYLVSYLLFIAVCNVSAQTNSSAPDSQNDDFTKFLERHKEEMQAPHPVYMVISLEREGLDPKINCWVGVMGHTNVVAYKPLPEQAFDAKLFDQNGKEIPKARFNHKFGRPLEPDKKLLDESFVRDVDEMYGHSRKLDFTNWDGTNHYWDFDVVKSFRVKKPGEYRLQVQVRLFVKDTNGVFQPFILPPVETQVRISESDLDR